ncbi:hypothetical protein [Candidatus Methanoperedens nitratireducens]|uniref:Uncharacterized protein n=1 Tax=Candidatus Methanoperedens nitratireducens TaxID=1392998 RepID=A0A284VSV0_9EURY|nr:hypothetical protein [Candidatus Methanoperedens nitroreducens]SNQ62263.1 hypothetical protein MNV_660001 [Candidatus Methanoperedens nitroreducens]
MTDSYILVAEFRTAADIGKCHTCQARLSGVYDIRDPDKPENFPECHYYCGD